MAEIIGVKFKPGGKLYYFRPNDEYLLQGTQVIVETARGLECGEVVMEQRSIPDEQISHELKSVLRSATAADLKKVEDNRAKEHAAFGICEQKILAHKLDMKLVSVEYAFDGSKILFCFTADGRIDFRELVKDLASVFRTRIELRQIGVRDEAKMLGGLGICGRPFCCSSFMGDFQPVSIKMAKEQGLSLNPVKISGTCGRLMCCLKYEEEAYLDLLRRTPRVGSYVNTPDGKGTIIEVNLLTGTLHIRMDDTPEGAPHIFNKKQIKLIRGKGQEDISFLDDEDEEELPEEEKSGLAELEREETGERPSQQNRNRSGRQGQRQSQQRSPDGQSSPDGEDGQRQGGQRQGGQRQGGQRQGGQRQGGQRQGGQRQGGQRQGGTPQEQGSNAASQKQQNRQNKPAGGQAGGERNQQSRQNKPAGGQAGGERNQQNRQSRPAGGQAGGERNQQNRQNKPAGGQKAPAGGERIQQESKPTVEQKAPTGDNKGQQRPRQQSSRRSYNRNKNSRPPKAQEPGRGSDGQ